MSGHGGWGGGWRGPGWRGAGWRGPGPPPWWPQGEAWPPAGRPPWPGMGRRFVWGVAWFGAAAFLLMAVVLAMGVVLVGTAVGLIGADPPVRILAVASLLLFVVIVARAGRRFRRMALNVGELVDAAGRIEAAEPQGSAAAPRAAERRTCAPGLQTAMARRGSTPRHPPALRAPLAGACS